eukprot:4734289-Pyramimonas_sp.AAC.1
MRTETRPIDSLVRHSLHLNMIPPVLNLGTPGTSMDDPEGGHWFLQMQRKASTHLALSSQSA